MDLTTLTTDQFISEAKRLRAAADESERAFLDFLLAAERHPHLWEGTGMTFIEFIGHANLCRPERYSGYKKALESLSVEETANVGVHALVAASRLKTKGQQRELLDRARMFEASNATTISEQSAERIARDLRAADVTLRTRGKGIMDLQREIEALKRHLADRDSTIVALRAEIKALQQHARTKSDPAKRPAKRRRRMVATAEVRT